MASGISNLETWKVKADPEKKQAEEGKPVKGMMEGGPEAKAGEGGGVSVGGAGMALGGASTSKKGDQVCVYIVITMITMIDVEYKLELALVDLVGTSMSMEGAPVFVYIVILINIEKRIKIGLITPLGALPGRPMAVGVGVAVICGNGPAAGRPVLGR